MPIQRCSASLPWLFLQFAAKPIQDAYSNIFHSGLGREPNENANWLAVHESVVCPSIDRFNIKPVEHDISYAYPIDIVTFNPGLITSWSTHKYIIKQIQRRGAHVIALQEAGHACSWQ
eukprot:10893890-Karenia_brevis.AAC.1